MKKIRSGIWVTVMLLVILSAFTAQPELPHRSVEAFYAARIRVLKEELARLNHLSHQLTPSNIEQLRQQYAKVRHAYKSCEYLLEMLEPFLVKNQINGAPLSKPEQNSFGLNIIEPKGMQVLNLLIYDVHPETLKAEIEKISGELSETFERYNENVKIYDRQVFEGIRLELIRLFTLGCTGFDTPGSDNALIDMVTVIEVMQQDMELYSTMLNQKDPLLMQELEKKLADFRLYMLKNQNFDKLDRLFVLRVFINPLYSFIYDAQVALEIEHSEETAPAHLLPPINLHTRNIFDNEFLNALKYTGIPPASYTDSLIQLGKMLFFDPVLSATNERSCAGCHIPSKGFTDGKARSIAMGFDGTVDRNAPTLLNCVYNERFFHDMRADALEDQIEHVVVSDKEFNSSAYEIMGKLDQSHIYRQWFSGCFPEYSNNPINKHTLSFAISAYVSSLRGFNSVFDRYVRGEEPSLPPAVKRGFNLFMGKAACGTCHFAPVFNGTVPPLYQESESEVLGVPADPYSVKPELDADPGRSAGKIKEAADFYNNSFKTPTLRNVELTAPYMHNGAYRTLEDVMEFYNKGGGAGLGLDVPHQTLESRALNLSRNEIKDIVAFMKALTDTSGLTSVPVALPEFETQVQWNKRRVGGLY